jgi:hypothetical protein
MLKKTMFFLICGICLTLAASPKYYRRHIQVAKVSGMTPENALEHPIWKKTPEYQMMHIVRAAEDINRLPDEGGIVQCLYDDQYFYCRVQFFDSDIINSGTKDGQHFYRTGDLLEIFIKPAKASYYWECYGTPNKLKTRFFYASRATLHFASNFVHKDTGLKVDAKVDGTMNDSSDTDKSYTVLLAMPISDLNSPLLSPEKHPAGTVPFAPGNIWLLQAARYNYGITLNNFELSCFPQSVGGFHSIEHFIEIELLK